MTEEDPLSVDWDIPKKPYPEKVITLPTGEKLVVREITRDEAPLVLEAIRPLLDVDSEYYDLVSARTYAELLGWYNHRVRNEYCLIGVVEGKLVGQVNNRMYDGDTCISYHTITLRRGRRIGAHLFAAKHEYAFDYLGAEEVLVTAESPRGFQNWMLEWGLERRPDIQHELGGANAWACTKEAWNNEVKPNRVFGKRPVPDELYETTLEPKIIKPDIMREESD